MTYRFITTSRYNITFVHEIKDKAYLMTQNSQGTAPIYLPLTPW